MTQVPENAGMDQVATGVQTTSTSEDLSGFSPIQLSEVSLVTQSDTGLVEVPGLNLSFDDNGMTIRKRTGDLVKVLPWEALLDITVEDIQINPIDPIASAMSVATERRSHEFRIKGLEARELSDNLAKLAKHYTGSQGIVEGDGGTLSLLLPYIVFAGIALLGLVLLVGHLTGHVSV